MRSFIVCVGYALNLVLLGLVSVKLTAEGSRALALVVPLVLASLVVMAAWVAVDPRRFPRVARYGRFGITALPVVGALAFLWLAGSASALEGLSARVLIYIALILISVQTLAQLWLLRRDEPAISEPKPAG